jgi:hypothetical protein
MGQNYACQRGAGQFAFIQNLRRAVSLPILLLPALLLLLLLVAASAVAGAADEIVTTIYTELSLPVPTTTLLVVCQGFDCEYHTEVALSDADRLKRAVLVASGRGSTGLFSPR